MKGREELKWLVLAIALVLFTTVVACLSTSAARFIHYESAEDVSEGKIEADNTTAVPALLGTLTEENDSLQPEPEPVRIAVEAAPWVWIDFPIRKEGVYLSNCDHDVPCYVAPAIDGHEKEALTAHAVVYECSRYPRRRFPGQLAVKFCLEPYHNCDAAWLASKDFDISMTFELSSDVPFTYARPWALRANSTQYPRWNQKKRSEYTVAYVASNCKVPFRHNYIKELMKYIKVDSFGSCLNNAQLSQMFPKCNGDNHNDNRCLYRNYLFVLAFENTIDDNDYVTEKLWNIWGTGAIPVYWGAPNFRKFLPGPHSLISVRDFSSHKALADYLLFLRDNETAYNEYFKWVGRPYDDDYWKIAQHQKSEKRFCDLCKLIDERRTKS